MKTKNHRCNLCGNRFARRDTLRRYVAVISLPLSLCLPPHSAARFLPHSRRTTGLTGESCCRHTEDGCPKRYEMSFRDTSSGPAAGPGTPATPARWPPLPTFTPPKRSYSLGCTYPGGPPSSMAPPLSAMSAHPPHPHPSFVSSPLQTTPAIYAS